MGQESKRTRIVLMDDERELEIVRGQDGREEVVTFDLEGRALRTVVVANAPSEPVRAAA